MSFTPPSTVGDIIAIVNLALQIRQALSDSRGASNDYRDLINELDAFRCALAVVEDRILASPPSDDIVRHIRREATTCRRFMQDFLGSIEGYKVLSEKRQHSTWRKILWSFFKAKEVGNFRQKISQRQVNILLYLGAMQAFTITSLYRC